jgi:hypothetical protein
MESPRSPAPPRRRDSIVSRPCGPPIRRRLHSSSARDHPPARDYVLSRRRAAPSPSDSIVPRARASWTSGRLWSLAIRGRAASARLWSLLALPFARIERLGSRSPMTTTHPASELVEIEAAPRAPPGVWYTAPSAIGPAGGPDLIVRSSAHAIVTDRHQLVRIALPLEDDRVPPGIDRRIGGRQPPLLVQRTRPGFLGRELPFLEHVEFDAHVEALQVLARRSAHVWGRSPRATQPDGSDECHDNNCS